MRRRAVVELTIAEAEALEWLASERMTEPEEYRANVGARRFKLSESALDKLRAAIVDARKVRP